MSDDNGKLRQLYDMYISKKIISEDAVSFEQFSAADEDQINGLRNLALDAQLISDKIDLNTFAGIFSPSVEEEPIKKKEETEVSPSLATPSESAEVEQSESVVGDTIDLDYKGMIPPQSRQEAEAQYLQQAAEDKSQNSELTEIQKQEGKDKFRSDFMEKVAPPRELNPIEQIGGEVFNESGLDYGEYKTTREKYERNLGVIKQMSDLPRYEQNLSDEAKEQYEHFYINGVVRNDRNNLIQELEKENDELRPVIMSEENSKAQVKLDLLLQDKFQEVASKSASINKSIAAEMQLLEEASMSQLGLSIEDLMNKAPANDSEARAQEVIRGRNEFHKEQQAQAKQLYDFATSLYNEKYYKQAMGDLVEGKEAFSNSLKQGYNRGKAAQYLLAEALNLDDSFSESAEKIANHIELARTGKTSINDVMWQGSRSGAEIFQTFKNDPLGLAFAFAGQSLAQMLPIGSRLIPAMTAGGTVVGGGIGSVVPVVGTIAGAMTGGGEGLKLGFAATNIAIEWTNSIIDAMEKKGYDMTDPMQVEAALLDDELIKEAGEIGLKRGLTIGAVDYLSAGFAGRVMTGGKLASKGRRLAGNLTERMIYDTAAEGFGEAAAQSVAGQKLNLKEIYAEMLGAVGNNAPMAAFNNAKDQVFNSVPQITNDLADVKTFALQNESDTKVLAWVERQQKKGKISNNNAELIVKNVGLRRDAREALNVGRKNKQAPVDPKTEARMMTLLDAKTEYESSPTRKLIHKDKITEINEEIIELGKTQNVREVATEKKVDKAAKRLADTGEATKFQTRIDLEKDNIERTEPNKYIYKGRAMTRGRFKSKVYELSAKGKLANADLLVQQDRKMTATIMKLIEEEKNANENNDTQLQETGQRQTEGSTQEEGTVEAQEAEAQTQETTETVVEPEEALIEEESIAEFKSPRDVKTYRQKIRGAIEAETGVPAEESGSRNTIEREDSYEYTHEVTETDELTGEAITYKIGVKFPKIEGTSKVDVNAEPTVRRIGFDEAQGKAQAKSLNEVIEEAESKGDVKFSSKIARVGKVISNLFGSKNSLLPDDMKVVEQLAAHIQKALPFANFDLSQEAFDSFMDSPEMRLVTKGGLVVYGVTSNGSVYVNPKLHSKPTELMGTLIHEFGHIWLNKLKSDNPNLYKRGIELAQETKEFKRQQKKFETDEQAADEALAILIGNKGQSIANDTLSGKFKDWLSKMWNYAKTTFKGSKSYQDAQSIEDMTLEDFTGAALYDMLSGKPQYKSNQKDAVQGALGAQFNTQAPMRNIIERGRRLGYTEASIRVVLKERGFETDAINEALTYRGPIGRDTMPRAFELLPYDDAVALFNEVIEASNEISFSSTFGMLRARVIMIMEDSAIYKAQPKHIRNQLLVSVDALLGIEENKGLNTRIQNIKRAIRNNQIGAANIRQAQAKLRLMIKDSFTNRAEYNKKTLDSLISIVNKATESTIFSDTIKIMTKVEAHREKVRLSVVKDISNILKKRAKTYKSKSNKQVASWVYGDGKVFFEEANAVFEYVQAKIMQETSNPASQAHVNRQVLIDKMDALYREIEANRTSIDSYHDKIANNEPLSTTEQTLAMRDLALSLYYQAANNNLEEMDVLLAKTRVIEKGEATKFLEWKRDNKKRREAIQDEANKQVQQTNPELFDENNELLSDNARLKGFVNIYKRIMEAGLMGKMDAIITAFSYAKPRLVFSWFAHLETITELLDRSVVGKKLFYESMYDKLADAHELQELGRFKVEDMFDDFVSGMGYLSMKDFKSNLRRDSISLTLVDSKTKRSYNRDFKASELMRIYALSLNETQFKKLERQGVDKGTLIRIKDFIGEDAVSLVDYTVEFLSDEYYEGVNNVYRESRGLNLKKIDNYFPTRTLKEKESPMDSKGDIAGAFFNAEFASAFKERTNTQGEVDFNDVEFFTVLDGHIDSMERYKAYAKPVKDIGFFLNTPSVKALIDDLKLSPMVRSAVDYAINPSNFGSSKGKVQGAWLNSIANKFTGMVLSFKLIQIPKQASSFIMAASEYNYYPKSHPASKGRRSAMNVLGFMADAAIVYGQLAYNIFSRDGLIHEATEISGTFRRRLEKAKTGDLYSLESGVVGDTDLIGKMIVKSQRAEKAFNTLKVAGATPTTFGDVLGVMGYMVNYKRNVKNGMSKEDAVRAFNNYNPTQQSRRGIDKAPIQMDGNILERAVTMFGSTTILYLNRMMSSGTNILRSLSRGKAPSYKDISRFVLSSMIGNIVFLTMANIFKLTKGDDDDRKEVINQLRNQLLGANVIHSIPFLGKYIESQGYIGKVFDKDYKSPYQTKDAINYITSMDNEISKSFEENKNIGLSIAQATLEATLGTNLDPFVALANLAAQSSDKDDSDLMYDILGVSSSYRPSNVGKDTKEKRTAKESKILKKRRKGKKRKPRR